MSGSLAEARSHNVPPEVFRRHWREIRDAKQAHADTGMALARAKKSAKSAGIDMDAFKDVEKLSELEEDEIRIREEHKALYAGWLDIPLGTQTDLFKKTQPADAEEHAEWEAAQAGGAAGKSGVPRDANPYDPGSNLHVAYDKAWTKSNRQWMKEQKKLAEDLGENANSGSSSGGRRRRSSEQAASIN